MVDSMIIVELLRSADRWHLFIVKRSLVIPSVRGHHPNWPFKWAQQAAQIELTGPLFSMIHHKKKLLQNHSMRTAFGMSSFDGWRSHTQPTNEPTKRRSAQARTREREGETERQRKKRWFIQKQISKWVKPFKYCDATMIDWMCQHKPVC